MSQSRRLLKSIPTRPISSIHRPQPKSPLPPTTPSSTFHTTPPRPIDTSPPAPPSTTTLLFSENQPPTLPPRAALLLPTWHPTPSGKGLTRTFTFRSFSAAWTFMSLVAEECKVQKHHPSWSNAYNRVTVEWTTHRPEGLSVKDVEMAEFCDRVAGGMGVKA
ncbi:transcriptional coactivator/pterin dehydratase [Dothidotthia symphoricarpi CBS 119687]|uniref:4a-hydroxytetrahydrobiopterin dehydratase n=1 Tax=Dothidotthia symphoricarpi CBS 119687 TaxID=1392245 RepID=A0A6A6APU8_9PLEO|nr:transcriptional coactivator/pterin dehydratase [Dothidotthia symphoricarpi CBS 119687]KAF2133188.1 transcriptional coactivator/pterin dehydratase [Dothidotthia symphoricarpi CBS 119687]